MQGRGFTLVELMIVVAIIGILAAIAIPNFYEMQLKAKLSELPLVASGASDAALVYVREADIDPAAGTFASGYTPSGVPGKNPQAWPAPTGNWAVIGFQPDGEVRGQYALGSAEPTACSGMATMQICAACVIGRSDMDGDSNYACGSTRANVESWPEGGWAYRSPTGTY